MEKFFERLKKVVSPNYKPSDDCIPFADLLVKHEFSILGSPLTKIYYGMKCKGFEGNFYYNPDHNYLDTRKQAEKVAPKSIESMQRAENLAKKLVPDYEFIPWHLDIITGYVYALDWHEDVPVACIPGVDAKTPSDFSRGHNLLTLACAYSLTKNKTYKKEAMAQLCDWLSVHPAYYGPGWRCGMNVAVRVANMVCATALLDLDLSDADDAEYLYLLKQSLVEHSRFIAMTLELWKEHNHVTSELACMTMLNALFSDEVSDDPVTLENFGYERIAWYTLNKQADHQIWDDGFNFENSVSYHAYVIEMFLYPTMHAARIYGCKTAKDVREFLTQRFHYSPEVFEKIRSMARVLKLITQPDGTIPYIGDADLGRFVEWEHRKKSCADMRFLSCVCAVLFDDATLLPVCVRDEDFISAYAFFDDAKILKPLPSPTSKALTDVGLTILSRDNFHCVFKAGSTTNHADCGHTNNDSLAITLCVDDKYIVVDPGTYTYTGDMTWRAKLRSINAHSTVVVDGEETNRVVSLYGFGGCDTETKTELVSYDETFDKITCTGKHNGFLRLVDLIHTYRTLTYTDHLLTIKDQFVRLLPANAPKEGEIVQRFVLHPECTIEVKDGKAIVKRGNTKVCFASPNTVIRVEDAYFSPSYGTKQDTKALCFVSARNINDNTIEISWDK